MAVLVHRRGPDGGRVALLLARDPARGGGWQPVTGKVEPTDPTLEDAARREVLEETGLAAVTMLDLGVESMFTGYDGHSYQERSFAAEALEGEGDVRLSEEHHDMAWVPFVEVEARLTYDENRRAFRALVAALDTG